MQNHLSHVPTDLPHASTRTTRVQQIHWASEEPGRKLASRVLVEPLHPQHGKGKAAFYYCLGATRGRRPLVLMLRQNLRSAYRSPLTSAVVFGGV